MCICIYVYIYIYIYMYIYIYIPSFIPSFISPSLAPDHYAGMWYLSRTAWMWQTCGCRLPARHPTAPEQATKNKSSACMGGGHGEKQRLHPEA